MCAQKGLHLTVQVYILSRYFIVFPTDHCVLYILGGCAQCPVGKYKLALGDGGCVVCELFSVPDMYWEWLPIFPPFSGADSQCRWRCINGFRQVAASDVSMVQCLPCTEKPANNPCSLGQFWDMSCNSSKDSGCVSCTGMIGEGAWTSSINWTASS